MAGLKDYIEENEIKPKKEKDSASSIVGAFKGTQKRLRLSLTVEPTKWAQFTEINKKRGLSNNGALNHFIAEYILEHENLLDE